MSVRQPLMGYEQIVWPSLFKSLNNYILSKFIIRKYMDKDFDMQEIVRGSIQGLEVISSKLAASDVNSLEGLVSSDIIPRLKHSVAKLSLSQRTQLEIHKEDLYVAFPYQVGILMENEEQKKSEQKRIVEIMMVFHAMRGLNDILKAGQKVVLNRKMSPEFRQRLTICNYRFKRDYTKGIQDDWTVNLINHFFPDDYLS